MSGEEPIPAVPPSVGPPEDPRRRGEACELCGRSVPSLTVHHLTPKEEGGAGGETIDVCPACHRQVHALFDNRTLAEELDSVAKLLAEPRFARFVRWVRKQDPGKRIAVRGQRDP